MVGLRLNLSPLVCDEQRLGELPASGAEVLRHARRILIIDDVVITGDRMRQYKHFLRTGGFLGNDPDVHWLARLRLRPTSCTALRSGVGVDKQKAPVVGQRDAIQSPPFMSPSSGE